MPERFVRMFLRGKLQDDVLRQRFDDVRWGLMSNCRSCEFLQVMLWSIHFNICAIVDVSALTYAKLI